MKLSIRTKLTSLVAIASLVCVSIGMGVLTIQRIRAFELERLDTAQTIAEAVGHSVVTSLAFQDPEDAREILARLAEFPDVESARVFDRRGRAFAGYPQSQPSRDPEFGPSSSSDAQRRLDDARARVQVSLFHDNQRYGSIELSMSARALQGQIRNYLVDVAVITGLLFAVTAIVAVVVQSTLTRRILDLSEVVDDVTREPDASRRVHVRGNDEIATLARGFNSMLAQLEERADALQRSNAQLASLVESSPLALVGHDASGRLVMCNPSAERMFGVAAPQVLGEPIARVMPPALLDALAERDEHEHSRPVDVELVSPHSSHAKHLRCTSSSLATEGGPGRVILALDDSEAHEARAALQERDHQLQRAQQMEAVGRLASGVSHDFNNLLTVIVANGELIRQCADSKDLVLECNRDILHAAERGAAMTSRILAFAGSQDALPETFDVAENLGNLWRMIRSVVGETIRCQLRSPPEALHVHLDPTQFEQVILNLVLNARDAMPKGGELDIELGLVRGDGRPAACRSIGDLATVAVRDTGVGMTPEVRSRVFDAFYTTKDHGTGLGLAMARRILGTYGGTMTVESFEGRGSCFTIWLPVAEATTEIRDESVPRSRTSPTGHERVLLVEDQADLRTVSQRLLERQGYRVTVASDGQEALALHESGHFELLITDIVMPNMGGIELTSRIRARQPAIPVLFMSGHFDNADELPGLDDRTALVPKPFSPDHWLRVARELLDGKSRESFKDGPTTV